MLNQLIRNSGNVGALHEFIDSVKESSLKNSASDLIKKDREFVDSLASPHPIIERQLVERHTRSILTRTTKLSAAIVLLRPIVDKAKRLWEMVKFTFLFHD